MKNVQVIDGAVNAAYCIYGLSERDFSLLFPSGQDIEFIDDFVRRVGRTRADAVMRRLWKHPVDKKKVHGIHGTLFFELEEKKKYYPTKRELEMEGLPPQFSRFQTP
jgi:hypothetical protein